jgi:hypothetical protein
MPPDESETKKKRRYVPPRIIELSGPSAEGRGVCSSGSAPGQGCSPGGVIHGHMCLVGSVVQAICNTGSAADHSSDFIDTAPDSF